MKKWFLFLVGIILILPFVLGSVVINEFESNPLGEDTDNEWIELFNDGALVDLNGWYITDKDSNQFLFPDVSIDDFYVLDGLNAFVNSGDNVSLFNSLDELQDSSGLLIDEDNDDKTWQRIPDGTGSFVFRDWTKGISNEFIIVPDHYATIQQAINNADNGDVIYVRAGNHVEDLVIDKELELVGEDRGTTVIKGVAITGGPNIQIHDVDNVKIHEFTIESPDLYSTSSGGIIFSGENIEIYDNIFISNFQGDDAYAVVMQTYRSQWVGDSWNLWKEHDISGLSIHNNIFEDNGVNSDNGYIGIWINRDSGLGGVSISENAFSGDIRWGIATERSNMLIQDNVIESSEGIRVGIGVMDWGDENPNDPEGYGGLPRPQENIQILGNAIKGFSNLDWAGIVLGVPGENQELIDIVINGNEIKNNSNGILISSFANEVNINYNDIFENGIGVKNDDSVLLDAENNYWGSCDGPSGVGLGFGDNVSINVDYEPWLGICIENKINVDCAIESEDGELEADLSGFDLDSVWFSYNIGGVDYNKTAEGHIGDRYYSTILSLELIGGENIIWNVYASDSTGRVYKNGEKTFYVRNKTNLIVNPLVPYGENGWYVNEPLFTLVGDGDVEDILYRWNGEGGILYSSPFGLRDVDDESAGIIKILYWSNFSCMIESKQNQTFKIDLTNPVIKDLIPEGIVYNNLRPEISVYLDEIHQGNSGINESSIVVELDGVEVVGIVEVVGDLDARVSYTPLDDLNEGLHNVLIYVEDNAGRSSELFWEFEIVLTGLFNLEVYSPFEPIYDSRRVKFNISTSGDVELMEYKNWDDRKPRWRRLCRNCDEYGFSRKKTKTLNEGDNNLSIRASDEFGHVVERNISLFVDSKKPRISRIRPKKNSIINGSEFYIKYTEYDLKKVELFWENKSRVLVGCDVSGRNKECRAEVNLSDYEDEWIEYWFEVSDSINVVESKKVKVLVDTTAPNITNSDFYTNDSRYIYFNLSIDEKNLDEVRLFYDYRGRTREKRLCSRLKDGKCEKRFRMRDSYSNLKVVVLDEAGNGVEVGV